MVRETDTLPLDTPERPNSYSFTEEIENLQGANEYSPRRGEIKVRKNEMKIRKKEIKVPMNFLIAPWRISVFYRGIFDLLGGVGSRVSKGFGVHRRCQSNRRARTGNL